MHGKILSRAGSQKNRSWETRGSSNFLIVCYCSFGSSTRSARELPCERFAAPQCHASNPLCPSAAPVYPNHAPLLVVFCLNSCRVGAPRLRVHGFRSWGPAKCVDKPDDGTGFYPIAAHSSRTGLAGLLPARIASLDCLARGAKREAR